MKHSSQLIHDLAEMTETRNSAGFSVKIVQNMIA
jgi:hypothetical protein